jgi:DNA-cytosine methyltransferase
MNVLSLFDGISAGQLALKRADIKVDRYFASEIDPYAIRITMKNFPNTIQLGDINNWKEWNLPKIDLIIGGSPCQGFSRAGEGLNFNDPRSKLLFTFVDILKEYNPDFFLLENVKMKQEWIDVITKLVKVNPIEINSSLLSAQNRKRLYWTNIKDIDPPQDNHTYLKDIVLEDVFGIAIHNIYGGFDEQVVRVFEDKSPTLRTPAGGGHIPSFVKKDLLLSKKALEYMDREVKDGRSHWDFKHYSSVEDPKSSAVVANFFKGVPYNVFIDWDCIRKFHPIECERLQTFPDNYTEGISNTQRYKTLGNSWTVDIVSHIFRFLPVERVNNDHI